MMSLLGPTWVIAFLSFSIITFISYQMIPHNLDALEKGGNQTVIGAIVSSKVFTLFVRWCGIDHMVMAFGMVGVGIAMSNGDSSFAAILARVIVVSSGGVALVSALSAYAIHTATAQKKQQNV